MINHKINVLKTEPDIESLRLLCHDSIALNHLNSDETTVKLSVVPLFNRVDRLVSSVFKRKEGKQTKF